MSDFLALCEAGDVAVTGCDLGFGSDVQTVSIHIASEAIVAAMADERSLAELMVSLAKAAIPNGYHPVAPAARRYDMAADFFVFTWQIKPIEARSLGDGA